VRYPMEQDDGGEPVDRRPSTIGIVAFTAGAGAVAASLMMSVSAFALFFIGGTVALALTYGARRQGDKSPLTVAGAALGIVALGLGVWAYNQNQRAERCAESQAKLYTGGGGDILRSFDQTVKDCAGLLGD
jgi:hypothetical protein